MNTLRLVALSTLSLLILTLAPIGTTSAQQIKVNTADPATTYQGTVSLDVTIAAAADARVPCR